MKTAMQELIEWLKEECDFLKNSDAVEDRFAASAFRNSFEKATELLEKEKEQIAGATSSSTVKELEREMGSWKKEYDAMRLDNFRQSKEIQRLKGLVEKALKTVFIWKQDTDLSDAAWNKFKTENNL